jgi:hypothetical protein
MVRIPDFEALGYFEGRDGSPSRPDASATRPYQRKQPSIDFDL